jgi:hypothetical protein
VSYSELVQQQHPVLHWVIEQEWVMVMLVEVVYENEDLEFFHQFLNCVHLLFYNFVEYLKDNILKQ